PQTAELARSIKAQRREGPARSVAPQAPPLPDKPSVAVLPFANLTSDHEQDFFADGITEEIISALSRIGDLFVISKTSSFVYKGRTVRAEDAARDLGVRYILEGSVRVAGNRVRVTAQLIDGQSGGHVWAERYEGDITDIFAVQDEITRGIALAMQVKLTSGESARLWEGQTQNLRAWEKMVEGRNLFFRWNPVDNSIAMRLLEEALLIDADYSGAMALLGLAHWWDARFNISADKEKSLLLAEREVEKILRFNSEMSSAYMLRGGISLLRYQHDAAIGFCERAVELAPSDAHTRAFLGLIYIFAGESEKARATIKAAMRYSPHHPTWFPYNYALASAWTGDFAAAQEAAEIYLRQEPNEPYAYVNLATIYGFQGHNAEAAAMVKQLQDRFPAFAIKEVVLSQPYRDKDRIERVTNVLRKAGLR
ncbi:MAG: hypothetical protein ACREVW_14105, partial [Burkholderiales bacterium]